LLWKLNISESLQILGDILNEFAAEKVRELAFEERREVNTLLNNANNYLKLMGELEKKESEIKECLGAKEDPEGVVTEISVLSKQDEIKLPMKSILNTLKFLQKIKPSIKGESTRMGYRFRTYLRSFKCFKNST
jgi:hypothetical protein